MLVGLFLAGAMWAGWVPGVSQFVWELESAWVDRISTYVGPAPERDDLVFLGIDDASLSLTGLSSEEIAASEVLPLFQRRWPWSRRAWAEIIDRLGEAGASQIVIDVLLTAPSEDAEADTALAEAIGRHRNKVVLAAVWGPMGGEGGGGQTALIEPDFEFLGPEDDETAYGYTNFWPGTDGVVRESIYRISKNEAQRDPKMVRHPDEDVFESLSAVVGRRMGALPPDEPKRLRFAVRGETRDGRETRNVALVYSPISVYKLFFEESWRTQFENGAFFKDKVVIIGPVAPSFQDLHATPAGTISGAQLHLQSVGCLVAGAFLNNAPAHWHWVGLVGMAMVGGLLSLWIRNPMGVILLAIVSIVVWMVGMVFIADHTSLLSGGISGVLGLVLVVVFGEAFEFLQEKVERTRLLGQLSRSVSRDVAAAMVKSPDGYLDSAKGGRRRIVVLFSDIRDFTRRSERENPEALVTQLNEYLSRMVDIIFANGGTLDKFIGDAIMATWGGLEDTHSEVMAEAAVKAAGEMLVELERLNTKWEAEGREPFQSGIGIHLGDAVVGEVGSRQRSDFTAIGDAVNLASRIEGMTKMLGVSILVSGEVAELQKDPRGLCSLGRFRVKGRNEPVEVAAAFVKNEELFLKGLAQFESGDLVSAEGALLEVSGDSGLGGPARFYLQQLEIWKQVPREEWDGVITLDSK